jgi:hypothetical protein
MPVVDQSSPVTDVQQAVPVAGEDQGAAVAIARRLMVQHFGPGKSSAIPADWVIDAMTTYAEFARLTEHARKADRLGEGVGEAALAAANFTGWPTKTIVDQCRMQAREQLDPEFSNFLNEVADRLSALPDPTHTREAEGVTVAEYNEVYDKFEEVVGGAFRDGFEEGWIYAQTPDGSDYDERKEEFGRAVDIEPSEAWGGYRDKYEAMLPVAALPALSAGSAQ